MRAAAWDMLAALPGPWFLFSSRRRHTRFDCDWSSDVCSSDLFCLSLCWCCNHALSVLLLPSVRADDSRIAGSEPGTSAGAQLVARPQAYPSVLAPFQLAEPVYPSEYAATALDRSGPRVSPWKRWRVRPRFRAALPCQAH